jgi:hypothetical protein
LTTILAQHLDLQVQAVNTVYSIFIFVKFFYNWDVMLYSLVLYIDMNTSNKPATSIFRARDALNVAAAGSSETLVSTYQSIQHHVLEDKYS